MNVDGKACTLKVYIEECRNHDYCWTVMTHCLHVHTHYPKTCTVDWASIDQVLTHPHQFISIHFSVSAASFLLCPYLFTLSVLRDIEPHSPSYFLWFLVSLPFFE